MIDIEFIEQFVTIYSIVVISLGIFVFFYIRYTARKNQKEESTVIRLNPLRLFEKVGVESGNLDNCIMPLTNEEIMQIIEDAAIRKANSYLAAANCTDLTYREALQLIKAMQNIDSFRR